MGNLPTRDASMLLARFNEAHLSLLGFIGTTDTRQLFKVMQFATSPCTSGGRDRQPFAVVRLIAVCTWEVLLRFRIQDFDDLP
jgi:hypothetical protein